ncbi:hypothetical protein B0H14DRAFT_3126147 [Mycena olivaceomarginata]|nr:hypothetical protein B0H14DRAFT_3126147 [Mycena olivaceomarginata]
MSDVFSTGVPGGCHGEEHEVRSGAGIIWSKAGWFRSFELIRWATQPTTNWIQSCKQLAKLLPRLAPRQGQDNWPGCTATIKAFSIGQKEFMTGQATFQSVPQNPNGGRRFARLRPQYPRTQTEVVACQATVSMPPEPKRGPQLARLRPRCPQDPNGGRGLPGHELNAPEPKRK